MAKKSKGQQPPADQKKQDELQKKELKNRNALWNHQHKTLCTYKCCECCCSQFWWIVCALVVFLFIAMLCFDIMICTINFSKVRQDSLFVPTIPGTINGPFVIHSLFLFVPMLTNCYVHSYDISAAGSNRSINCLVNSSTPGDLAHMKHSQPLSFDDSEQYVDCIDASLSGTLKFFDLVFGFSMFCLVVVIILMMIVIAFICRYCFTCCKCWNCHGTHNPRFRYASA